MVRLRGGAVVVRTWDSQSIEPGFESSCCRSEAEAALFTPPSVNCIIEYLAVDSGGYVNETSSRNDCSVAECFPEKSRWCWNERYCQWVNFNQF